MTMDSLRRQLSRARRRDLWLTLTPTLLLIALAFSATLYFVKPAPPKHLVLALAPDEGGARYYARRYQELLKKDGITVELRNTEGSAHSVALLTDPAQHVDVAFVQSGLRDADKVKHVVSLGSLSYVPLWVFYRGAPVEDLRGLAGKRIAVGPEDSSTRALALTLLEANGIASGTEGAPTQLVPAERDAAMEALKAGTVDAAFVLAPAESPAVKKLAAVPGIQLLSFARADAYVRRYPYLSKLVLPRGVFDLAKDVPAHDVVLLSPTANLVARDSLHPALAYLLMRAGSEIHGGAGLLDRAGEFPAPLEAGFPLSSEARRYYQAGVPLLQRYLPFWAANLVDRLWVMLVPIIAVVVPLGRAVPALYRWRVRSRVFRWYARLKEIEIQLEENPGRPMLEDMLKRLEETERSVNQIPTPLAYAENLYFFREHVDVVRRRLVRRLAGVVDDSPAETQATG
ncbi:C4-dicarboxylate ABC transporter substrate-binding protein [Aggregicoccus sp. 17bor-14]|uniref:TAXI family TRAP transporter solute-binding subunit n=1 Tax=Myxococcaceae TaxID=31 RepID=UPI00129C72EF|nr:MULTISPECIES: TAXI family TRAP transporter solute-binding subunit [Myxococcaceae]MBF5042370.1 ABC transporter substrate-binding protein [Simulacricoccus sp. 17bor-14]MRI88143.1 C4-dicarboxylate ABC transporter substrate-binding protein [Aggregicoccus sp. 17bor-14]